MIRFFSDYFKEDASGSGHGKRVLEPVSEVPYCCHQGYDGQKYDVASQADRTDKYKG